MNSNTSYLPILTPGCCGACPASATGVCRKWNREDASRFPMECPLKNIHTIGIKKPDGKEVTALIFTPPSVTNIRDIRSAILKTSVLAQISAENIPALLEEACSRCGWSYLIPNPEAVVNLENTDLDRRTCYPKSLKNPYS